MATTFDSFSSDVLDQNAKNGRTHPSGNVAANAITSVVFNDNGTVTITKGGSATTYTNLDNSLKSKVETTVNSGDSITDLFDHVFSTNSLTAV